MESNRPESKRMKNKHPKSSYKRLCIFMELENGDIHQVLLDQEQMDIVSSLLWRISKNKAIQLTETKYPEIIFNPN